MLTASLLEGEAHQACEAFAFDGGLQLDAGGTRNNRATDQPWALTYGRLKKPSANFRGNTVYGVERRLMAEISLLSMGHFHHRRLTLNTCDRAKNSNQAQGQKNP